MRPVNRLLTTQEAAEIAGVGSTAIKRWADLGQLPCVRTAGGHRRIREEDLRAFLGANEESPARGTDEVQPLLAALAGSASVHEVQARLLSLRARHGAWYRAAATVGGAIYEIGRRWEAGALTIAQEHSASERLARALAQLGEMMPLAPDSPVALLVSAEGDDHTLGLSLAELCIRELGWSGRWSGRDTPTKEVLSVIADDSVDLILCSASSLANRKTALERWANTVGEACQARSLPLVLGGQGDWPESPAYGARLRSFDELHSHMIGLNAAAARVRRK